MADSTKMFADRDSIAEAVTQLHPEIDEATRSQAVDEILESGSGAEQIGRLSLQAILKSFCTGPGAFANWDDIAALSESEAAADPWLALLRKLAAAGVSRAEMIFLAQTLEKELLGDVLLALDNNVSYEEVAPYSEFGVWLVNTHTNEPEAHVDGLHEMVEDIFEQLQDDAE